MAARKKSRSVRREVTFEAVRQAAQSLPGVEDSTSYGTPALKVKGQLLARLHQSGECFVLRTTFEDRSKLITADPAIFHITDHYQDYPWVLVRFLTVDPDALPKIVEEAWRLVAPKSLIKKFDTDADKCSRARRLV
jgi:hypothetical protein